MTFENEKTSLPAIVLAAGESRRFDGKKLFAPYQGKALIEWTLAKWSLHPLVSKLFLVVQPEADEMAKFASHYSKVQLVANPQWKKGMASSIAAGIGALGDEVKGVLVGLADTPFFEDATLTMVVPTSAEIEFVRLPVFDKVPGHPKYFPRWCFQELLALRGDQGAKELFQRFPKRCHKLDCQDPGSVRDFDLPSDFALA